MVVGALLENGVHKLKGPTFLSHRKRERKNKVSFKSLLTFVKSNTFYLFSPTQYRDLGNVSRS